MSNIYLRPIYTRVVQAIAISGSSYIVEVYYYYYNYYTFYKEISLITEDSSIIKAPRNNIV